MHHMRYDRFKNTFQNILFHYIYIMFSRYVKDEVKWERTLCRWWSLWNVFISVTLIFIFPPLSMGDVDVHYLNLDLIKFYVLFATIMALCW